MADPRIGTNVGPYRILDLIGRGGMGVVYLAEHEILRRRAAIKVIAPELGHDPVFRERFLEESRLAASIDHPNIVPIYEAGEAAGALYLAMTARLSPDVLAAPAVAPAGASGTPAGH